MTDSKKSKDYPIQVLAALSHSQVTEKVIEALEAQRLKDLTHDCDHCDGKNTVNRDLNHIHTNKELDLKVTVPAFVCSNCGDYSYEPEDYKIILEAEENAQGRHYVRFTVKDGRIIKYSMH